MKRDRQGNPNFCFAAAGNRNVTPSFEEPNVKANKACKPRIEERNPNNIISYRRRRKLSPSTCIIPYSMNSSTALIQHTPGGLSHIYKIGPELGRGSSGIVYRCTSVFSGEHLACKSITKNKLSNQEMDDVQREVRIMERLSHHQVTGNPQTSPRAPSPKHTASISISSANAIPSGSNHVVRLHQVLEDEKQVHLVMELCHGGQLSDRMQKQGKFSEAQAATIIKGLVEAIKFCHGLGIMHRDIKPENILFVNEGENSSIKLADFGLAIEFSAGDRFSQKVGSPFYVAPELLCSPTEQESWYAEQIDIWSSGILLYSLLCGDPPFWGLESIRMGELQFPECQWKNITSSAQHLISGMLCRDPQKRMLPGDVLKHPWILTHAVGRT